MHHILDCRHMELLCCQRAIANPEHSWKWQARAESCGNLGHRKTISSFERSNSGQPNLSPMAIDRYN
jgi:hypothetical protein